MGARMLSGHTKYHEEFERQAAEFEKKEAAYLFNFGYQGMVSMVDALVDRNDVIVYDAECHACMLDGMRLHIGKRFPFAHNDMENLEKKLINAKKVTDVTGGGILVMTEGVFGMSGQLGNLKGITDLKDKYNFRLLIDDAHGFGDMGATGAGTSEHFGVMDKVDVYFATFAKSMAGIGAFVATDKKIVDYLRFNMRSQVYAKSLPMPMTIGALKRLEIIRSAKGDELRKKLWTVVHALQDGLRADGIEIGSTQAPVTPVVLNGTEKAAVNLTHDIRKNYNIFCSIVIYPVVPKGTIILRLIPTAIHTLENVEYTVNAFKEIKKKLASGYYDEQPFANLDEI